MPSRKIPFVPGEIYHCFNRGVNKRTVFSSETEFQYFLDCLELFNQTESKGSMQAYRTKENYLALKTQEVRPLVSVLSYCLLPNHFHLLLQEECDDGITQFMRKVTTGYTMYFNKEHIRSGSLFQGQFKAVHINTDIQLRHVFSYVTLNYKVHKITTKTEFKSSYDEVLGTTKPKICNKDALYKLLSTSDLAKLMQEHIQITLSARKESDSYSTNNAELLE